MSPSDSSLADSTFACQFVQAEVAHAAADLPLQEEQNGNNTPEEETD